jgi:hypothetical protein
MVRVWRRERRAALGNKARFARSHSVPGTDRAHGRVRSGRRDRETGVPQAGALVSPARGLAYRNQACNGVIAIYNYRFGEHEGTCRVPAVLRCIAALLHFVATGKNGSGKGFDGQRGLG